MFIVELRDEDAVTAEGFDRRGSAGGCLMKFGPVVAVVVVVVSNEAVN